MPTVTDWLAALPSGQALLPCIDFDTERCSLCRHSSHVLLQAADQAVQEGRL